MFVEILHPPERKTMPSIDIKQVPALAKQFRDYMDQFSTMLVGRDHELMLLRYALVQREHILLFGPPGTSKTQISDLVFAGIEGGTTFAIEMSKFMAEDALFGPYDVKAMREEGTLRHRIEGMMPEAQLVRVGEFLDANEAVLRSMLGVLNERRMIRGVQKYQTPLLTAFADTNIDPGEYLRRSPNAWAVIDRILFLSRLSYLSDPADIGEMVNRFQSGQLSKPKTTIPIDVIIQLSSLIVTPPGLITDPSISLTYGKAVAEYRVARAALTDEEKTAFILPEISDRRVVKGSQMLEAEAVIQGRLHVFVEDLLAARWVLCTSEVERELWVSIAQKYIEEHKARQDAQLVNSQGIALTAIADQLEKDVVGATNGAAVQVLSVLWGQFQTIAPTNPEVEKIHQELKTRFLEVKQLVAQRAVQAVGLDDSIGS